MIQLRQITKIYDSGKVATPALLGVDLDMARGDFAAIMGPSGSGKSTVMHIMGLLDRPTSGSYLFEGQEVTGLGDDGLSGLRNERMGFVFQAFHLLPSATALKNVLLPFIYAPRYPADAAERGRRALTAVGLEHRLHHRPGELSGGESQRVAIARALVTDPEVIFADEPTGNLDRRATYEVMATLQRLNREEGKTVILVTHDNHVGEMCKRVVRLVYGRIDSDTVNPAALDAAQILASLPPPEEDRR
ncbi:MAG: ABC transporter ATP-binding protein [Pseudomonadota bacterium]